MRLTFHSRQVEHDEFLGLSKLEISGGFDMRMGPQQQRFDIIGFCEVCPRMHVGCSAR